MESYGLIIPGWLQAVIDALVIFVLIKYGSKLSMKWTGIAWAVTCVFYLLIVALKIYFFSNIIAYIVGVMSALFFFKLISFKSKMPKIGIIIVSFLVSLIWLIGYMFILGLIFNN